MVLKLPTTDISCTVGRGVFPNGHTRTQTEVQRLRLGDEVFNNGVDRWRRGCKLIRPTRAGRADNSGSDRVETLP